MKTFIWFLRIALAGVFVAAAVAKIAAPADFHRAIQTYRMLPDLLVALTAIWLPWFELCTAGALLWPRHRRAALWIIVALSIVFLIAIAQAWWRGLDIICGCFGRPTAVSGAALREYLLRDLALLATASWLLTREKLTSGKTA